MRVDDLARQELQESQSTQLTVQNQELQDNSHPSIVTSSFGMPCRDFGPQPGSVFENPSASDEPTASCSGNVYARSPTATHVEPMFSNTGRSEARVDEMERNTQSFTILTPRFARTVSTWNPPSLAEGTRKICG